MSISEQYYKAAYIKSYTLHRRHALSYLTASCTCVLPQATIADLGCSVSIELPAGLLNEGETAGDAALRELREETGYSGNSLRFMIS